MLAIWEHLRHSSSFFLSELNDDLLIHSKLDSVIISIEDMFYRIMLLFSYLC